MWFHKICTVKGYNKNCKTECTWIHHNFKSQPCRTQNGEERAVWWHPIAPAGAGSNKWWRFSLTREKEPEFRFKGKPVSPEKSFSETRRMKLPLVQFSFFPDPWACLAGASELTSFNQLTFSAVLSTASCTIDLNQLHSQSDLSLKQIEKNALNFFSTCVGAA